MAQKPQNLTREEYASLLKVGNTCAVLEPPAVIPSEHSSRLIRLGYMVDLARPIRESAVFGPIEAAAQLL
jgi:hypothetical protein